MQCRLRLHSLEAFLSKSNITAQKAPGAGLAWGQGGGGLHTSSGEAKLNKSQSMANPTLSRVLLGTSGRG